MARMAACRPPATTMAMASMMRQWRSSTNQWFTQGTTHSFGANGDKPLPKPYAVRQVFFP